MGLGACFRAASGDRIMKGSWRVTGLSGWGLKGASFEQSVLRAGHVGSTEP